MCVRARAAEAWAADLARHGLLDLLPHVRHRGRDEADVRQALLHYHGADVRLGGRVGRLPHHLDVDRVEALLGQRELAVLLELDRVVRAELDVRVLQDILAAQPQLAGHRVEVDVLDHDLQRQPHALAVRAAGGGLVLDLAHGGGLDAVARVAGDEVEDVPHVLVLVWQQRDRAPAVLLEAALEDLHKYPLRFLSFFGRKRV